MPIKVTIIAQYNYDTLLNESKFNNVINKFPGRTD